MVKRIAICFASTPFVRGGAELCVESLAEELKHRGYMVDIVSLPFQWEPKGEVIKNMLMWRLVNIDRVAGKPVNQVICTKFPSYMIKHPNKITWLFHQHRAAYDLFGTPFSSLDMDDPEDIGLKKQIIRADEMTLAESRTIYTISKNVSNRLSYYNHINAKPLYHPPKHRGKYYCDSYGDYILSVGRLEGLKRVDLLIQALQYTDKDVKCIIAGEGTQKDELMRLAKNLGLKDRIKFLGFVGDEDLLKLYAGAFSVYFAPYDEDYGYVTLESFLSKKPVVTCVDSGGVMEFVEHDINAKVAKDADPVVLGAYINELFNNTAACSKLGENGYARVKDISWDDVIKKLTATL